VAAANILIEPLRNRGLTPYDLEHIQHYREDAVFRTQRFQIFAHRILNRVLRSPEPIRSPLLLRLVTALPGFQQFTAKFIGIGIQPEHVEYRPAG
jgi:hypothetical protein